MQQTELFPEKAPRKKPSGKKNRGYINRRSADGLFQPDIYIEVNEMLNVYCRVKGLNKTRLVNRILKEWLEGEFEVLSDGQA